MSFEDGCKEMYEKVFSDTDPTTWLLFGYTGKKITPQHAGEGGLDELVANFEDNQVQYALLRLTKMDDGGDSKRTKFVFITWVGEDAPALKKGMVNMHKNTVGGLFVGFHIEKAIYERSELDSLSDELDSKLKAAAGANYDLGNIRSGATGTGSVSYKNKSKEFFTQKDKESEIKDVQYEKFLRQGKEVMECDISGRSMVAPPSEAQRNTVGYNKTAASRTGGNDPEPATKEAETKSEEKQPEVAADAEPAPADHAVAPEAETAAEPETAEDKEGDAEASGAPDEKESEEKEAESTETAEGEADKGAEGAEDSATDGTSVEAPNGEESNVDADVNEVEEAVAEVKVSSADDEDTKEESA